MNDVVEPGRLAEDLDRWAMSRFGIRLTGGKGLLSMDRIALLFPRLLAAGRILTTAGPNPDGTFTAGVTDGFDAAACLETGESQAEAVALALFRFFEGRPFLRCRDGVSSLFTGAVLSAMGRFEFVDLAGKPCFVEPGVDMLLAGPSRRRHMVMDKGMAKGVATEIAFFLENGFIDRRRRSPGFNREMSPSGRTVVQFLDSAGKPCVLQEPSGRNPASLYVGVCGVSGSDAMSVARSDLVRMAEVLESFSLAEKGGK